MVVCALLVPLVPFAILGTAFEDRLLELLRTDRSPCAVFLLVGSLLAADILLPVPSSAIGTYAGATLGWFSGTAASWIGLTLGASLAFAAAGRLGSLLNGNRPQPTQDVAAHRLIRRGAAFALFVSRPLPIIAEACVITLGLTGLEWRRFLGPLCAANLIVAFGYAGLGRWFAQSDSLVTVLLWSALLPLVPALGYRQWSARRSETR